MRDALRRLGGAVCATLLVVGVAAAASAEDTYTVSIVNHAFVPSEVKVKAGTKLTLTVKNEDKTAEEFESHDLNREKLIRGGGTATIKLPALKPGRYEFFGEFHPDTARGWIVAE